RVHAVIVIAHVFAAIGLGGPGVILASAQPPPQVTPQKGPVQPAAMPIPVPEIAQRAEQVAALLRSIEQSGTGPSVEDIEARLPTASEWIRRRLLGTTQALMSSPSENALAILSDSWRLMRSKLATWNDTLTGRATQLGQGVEQLEAMRTTWSVSR